MSDGRVAHALPGESPAPQALETAEPAANTGRPEVRGKFLFVGQQKLRIKGVTYGTFRRRGDGASFPEDAVVAEDFAAIADAGFNAIRTYSPPSRSVLDLAHRYGLRVMVGLPWSQHVTFLDDPGLCREIRDCVRAGVRECASHEAVLAYAVGNEIPASIVRWHGSRRIERFVHDLASIVKSEDPSGLVTYVNFPTTEYLHLPFLDFLSFNVYLERRSELEAYLSRLQNLANERPLVLAEVGLDSRRNGVHAQAENIDWQLRSAFLRGCAGAFVFSWTDEWHRGGANIDDWDFGLTTRARVPKPALEAVSKRLLSIPFGGARAWPRVSVVVCSLNGGATIRDTMEGLSRLDYPDFEIIVIDDGSTDETAAIAGEYPTRVISTENRGLSNARNTGWQAASGEIVAYIDDDAYPDADWLSFLVTAFEGDDFVGVGGPNLAPAGDGWIAECVANAPGGPVHVLLTDTVAEHIPGCNMAFRRRALAEVGGFDPIYRAAGDDVDLCWRLQDRGWTIGFAPAAMVWHHRRNSLKAYWRQQLGYGKAEALLERKWPQRYNTLGHLTWSGRLYGLGLTHALAPRARVYHGPFGFAPFQSVYQRASNGPASLPLMPEWYLLTGIFVLLMALGILWTPLLALWPLLAIAAALPVAQALLSAARARFPHAPRSVQARSKRYALTALLHLVQPLARLAGRLKHGLRPWRGVASQTPGAAAFRKQAVWLERWREPNETALALLDGIRSCGGVANPGGNFDDWDIEVRGGLFGSVRVRMAVEEHGSGKQLYRFATTPRVPTPALLIFLFLGGSSLAALYDGAAAAALVLLTGACSVALVSIRHLRVAAGTVNAALSQHLFAGGAMNSVPS
jgi:GT2 family glycosyltransferase